MVWREPVLRFSLWSSSPALRWPPIIPGSSTIGGGGGRRRLPRRQRPRDVAGFGEGRALRRSPTAHRRIVACGLECRGQRRAGGLRGARGPALERAAVACARNERPAALVSF